MTRWVNSSDKLQVHLQIKLDHFRSQKSRTLLYTATTNSRDNINSNSLQISQSNKIITSQASHGLGMTQQNPTRTKFKQRKFLSVHNNYGEKNY